MFSGAGEFDPRVVVAVAVDLTGLVGLLLPLHNPSRDFRGAVPADVCCEIPNSFRLFMFISVSVQYIAVVDRKLDGHSRRITGLAYPRKLVGAIALDVTTLPGGDGAEVSITKNGRVSREFREDCVEAVADEDSGFFFGCVDVVVSVAVGYDSRWQDLHGALR